MKATMNVNAKTIELALVSYFANLGATIATLRYQPNEDWYGHQLTPIISADVVIEVGESVAQ